MTLHAFALADGPVSAPCFSSSFSREPRPRPLPRRPVVDFSAVSDAALVRAVRDGDRGAAGALFDRHAPRVSRVLRRVLGPNPEVADLLQDVFVQGLRDLAQLRDPSSVGPWLTGIAVHLARRAIRSRRRWAWIRFIAPEDVPEVEVDAFDDVATAELAATFAVLATLPTDERIAFSLRFLDGMELAEVARVCDVSLATIKRRLRRAEDAFRAGAARHPALRERLLSR